MVTVVQSEGFSPARIGFPSCMNLWRLGKSNSAKRWRWTIWRFTFRRGWGAPFYLNCKAQLLLIDATAVPMAWSTRSCRPSLVADTCKDGPHDTWLPLANQEQEQGYRLSGFRLIGWRFSLSGLSHGASLVRLRSRISLSFRQTLELLGTAL